MQRTWDADLRSIQQARDRAVEAREAMRVKDEFTAQGVRQSYG